jgi:DNA-nicking Smr family endonuclease
VDEPVRDPADPPVGEPADGPGDQPDPVELPIDGALDLHTFHPREVKDLVPEYLAACRAKGILEVRIIHGKGTGALRRTVHAVLDRLPEVVSYRLAEEDRGSWGATLVVLAPDDEDSPPVDRSLTPPG